MAVKCTAESTGLKMHSVMFATKQAQSESLTTTMTIDEAVRKSDLCERSRPAICIAVTS